MFSRRRSIAILTVGVALGVAILHAALQPVRHDVSERYVARGDTYMEKRDFDLAMEEYAKALTLDPFNGHAKRQDDLAKAGQVDIAVLRTFYDQRGVTSLVQTIDSAKTTYSEPKLALQAGLALYQKHEYSLARYPLEQAVILDPRYPEAWHYLGLTYDELSGFDAAFSLKSQEAFAKRDALTTNYLQL